MNDVLKKLFILIYSPETRIFLDNMNKSSDVNSFPFIFRFLVKILMNVNIKLLHYECQTVTVTPRIKLHILAFVQ